MRRYSSGDGYILVYIWGSCERSYERPYVSRQSASALFSTAKCLYEWDMHVSIVRHPSVHMISGTVDRGRASVVRSTFQHKLEMVAERGIFLFIEACKNM